MPPVRFATDNWFWLIQPSPAAGYFALADSRSTDGCLPAAKATSGNKNRVVLVEGVRTPFVMAGTE
jgi:hypothetical protein